MFSLSFLSSLRNAKKNPADKSKSTPVTPSSIDPSSSSPPTNSATSTTSVETKFSPTAPSMTILPTSFILVLPSRMLDFKKNPTSTKPLLTTGELKHSSSPQYGGIHLRELGPHSKFSKQDHSVKTVFVMNHQYIEYFVMEILQHIGFNTPTIRLLLKEFGKRNYLITSQMIHRHIPIRVFRETIPPELMMVYPAYKELQPFSAKYRLNIKKQVIEHRYPNSGIHAEYKLSGNLFCTDLAAILFGDKDLQPKQENIVLVRHGNRFKVFLIDKDIAPENFGKKYHELIATLAMGNKNIEEKPPLTSPLTCKLLSDELFQHRTPDQQLAIVFQLQQALEVTATRPVSEIQSIFMNDRVKNTFDQIILDENGDSVLVVENLCRSFVETARSFIQHYLETFGTDCLTEFAKRETVRTAIAERIAAELLLPKDFIPHIVEDLRGPYYSKFFPTHVSRPYHISKEGYQRLKIDLAHELFHDITGLELLFEEHITNYQPSDNRNLMIADIRAFFADLKKDVLKKESIGSPTRSEIAIALGFLLMQREKAQSQHESGFSLLRSLNKPVSDFATIIDAVIEEFCELSSSNQIKCKAAYHAYEAAKPPVTRDLDKINQLTRAANLFF